MRSVFFSLLEILAGNRGLGSLSLQLLGYVRSITRKAATFYSSGVKIEDRGHGQGQKNRGSCGGTEGRGMGTGQGLGVDGTAVGMETK